MKTGKVLPVLLLTGYLGSGKTTLLNRILNNRRGIKFAVIVNDIGEVNIDADLIAKGGVVGQGDDSLVPLQNGCICCTLKTDLMKQLQDLADAGTFDYIVIEASGICEPEPIAQTICTMTAAAQENPATNSVRLDCICTVVDALRLRDEFDAGAKLTRRNIDEEDIENLIIQQIEFCDMILLNKIDEVSKEEGAKIRSIVRAIQPTAEIVECNYCDVELDTLLNTGKFDFEKVATSATWVKMIEAEHNAEHGARSEGHEHCDHEHGVCHCHHHHHHDGEGEAEEYGIGTFVYFARRPFSLNKFDWFCAKKWPRSVIRCKGVCWFQENPDMSYLFEQAGSQKRLMEAGRWYATAPEEDLEVLMAREPGLMNDWDPEYGDRMQKLVFIGQHMDRAAITKALDDCLEEGLFLKR